MQYRTKKKRDQWSLKHHHPNGNHDGWSQSPFHFPTRGSFIVIFGPFRNHGNDHFALTSLNCKDQDTPAILHGGAPLNMAARRIIYWSRSTSTGSQNIFRIQCHRPCQSCITNPLHKMHSCPRSAYTTDDNRGKDLAIMLMHSA